MPSYTIQTQNLDFRFAKKQILHNIALDVPQSSIYGFLGPNGAGKSTTIRLLLGLLDTQNPDAHIKIFGLDLAQYRVEILRRIGALVEMPSLYEHLNARENLEITRVWVGNIPKSRIEEVLRIVDIAADAHRPVRQFSLGMKQRLGLALSLLANPELLILDEPTNGLDPAGIKDIRELLIRLNQQEGTTIFISSHLLSEVEKIATHVGIIHQGLLHFQGDITSLHAQQQSHTLFDTNDNAKAVELIRHLTPDVQLTTKGLIVPSHDKQLIHTLNQTLIRQDVEVYQIQTEVSSLEDVFMGITGGNN